MSAGARHIVFFRSERADDPFRTEFEASGFTVDFAPLLRTEYVPEPALPLGEFDAVVVTSRRSLEALARRPKLLARMDQAAGGRPWHAVGPATREAALRLGIRVHADPPGTSEALAGSIAGEGARHVLLLAGEPHRPDLGRILAAQGVGVSTAILYRTRLDMPSDPPPDLDWAVLFSPRGAQAVVPLLLDRPGCLVGAIGPTTARALRDLGIAPDAVADSPDARSLRLAVARVLRGRTAGSRA